MNEPNADPLPGELSTSPDQISPDALNHLDLLPGERLARCWRTSLGFLVMTNLQCVHVWQKLELFSQGEWHTGPTFLFYDMTPPQVVAGRFLALTEGLGGDSHSARFLVHDPNGVCREIEAARVPGRAEWEVRSALAKKTLGQPHAPAPPPGATIIVREIVKVRCRYCGNLMDASDTHCPACGAGQS
ncbi:MAG: zinc ribbon domain-containing protein [Thermoplasmata archaeon]